MFYVAITRAKATCILSYASRRTVQGQFTNMTFSRFVPATGLIFNNPQTNQLSAVEQASIQDAINDL